MQTAVLGAGDATELFTTADIFEARFHLETATEDSEPARRLYLRAYELVDTETRMWKAQPEAQWPLIATILPNRIIMRPIHVNPYAQRYLSPKNGQFRTVTFVDDRQEHMLDDPDAAAASIERRLETDLFDPPGSGLGLNNNLAPVWQGLSRIRKADVIVVSHHPDRHVGHNVVSVGIQEVDSLRRAFNRVTTRGRRLIRETKQGIVHDDVLTRLDPERFQRIVQVNPPLVEVRREGVIQSSARSRTERRSTVNAVRNHLDELATEAPLELMMLHAEIERVTLAKMLATFRAKMSKRLAESQWQAFFEQNRFVLSLAFARPVQLTHTQFHAKGSTLTGAGAQIGDFLFREMGQALAIVEIKTPETLLLRSTPYRGDQVFGPHSELSGAITQVLFQQSELRKRWMVHANDVPALRSSDADAIKCVVVAGRLPTDVKLLRSFEVFRNACKDVDIVTFDELLSKLEFLEQQLKPEPEQDIF